jgi:hypothetical protein
MRAAPLSATPGAVVRPGEGAVERAIGARTTLEELWSRTVRIASLASMPTLAIMVA